jgi:hypothetical protein
VQKLEAEALNAKHGHWKKPVKNTTEALAEFVPDLRVEEFRRKPWKDQRRAWKGNR